MLDLYYAKALDIAWLEHCGPTELHSCAAALFETLRACTVEDCFESVCRIELSEPITSANIPQFSDVAEVTNVARALVAYGEWLSYDDLGRCLSPDERKKKGAYTKYGENHGKLAALLDIACVEFKDARRGCQQTLFSKLFLDLGEDEQKEMLAKLSFRIPVIANVLRDARDAAIVISDYLVILSDSTKKRRLPNVATLLKLIDEPALRGSALHAALQNVGR